MGGFTLLELMIAAAVIAILVAIAYPSYRDYVVRGQLIAGTNALLQVRTSMEQYFQDNRNYGTDPTCGVTMPTGFQNFTLTCATVAATSTASQGYTVTATGSGGTAGFIYTIDQNANQATSSISWGGNTTSVTASCWLTKRAQTC
jgi:type IV pilus assembly protein PilE